MVASTKPISEAMRVYLAGPLFSQAERRWLRELAAVVAEAGHSVFLPQDDAEAPLHRDPPDFQGVIEACRVAIERSDALIAVLDGFDTDSGTASASMLGVEVGPIDWDAPVSGSMV